MTDLEKIAYNTLLEVRAYLTIGRKVNQIEFQNLMGKIRDAIRMFENQMSGCSTGTHTGRCSCQPAIIGRHVRD